MSDFQKTLCKITGDVCYKTKLENGLTLYIAPNETTTYHAVFYTNFGSADSVFEKDGKVWWRCRNCGYICEAEKAPIECPACAHAQAHFELLAEKW